MVDMTALFMAKDMMEDALIILTPTTNMIIIITMDNANIIIINTNTPMNMVMTTPLLNRFIHITRSVRNLMMMKIRI